MGRLLHQRVGSDFKSPVEPMRTLIIPDIHNQTDNADHWIATQRYDGVVFLGDYFDSSDDNVGDARTTACWLRDRMRLPQSIFLLGNHDVAYMFPNEPEVECPGFTRAKARAIHEVLTSAHWEKFQLAWEEQSWLLSHAGFHPVWIDEPSLARIVARCRRAMELARRGKLDPILGYGEKPGGIQRFGGPLWMDWESFLPIAGINQIVGHTRGSDAREKTVTRSRNYCLDVGDASVAAILSDGELTILDRRLDTHV
jgi:hypothetical protein